MKKLTSKQVRQMWLDFFESKGHKVMESKSLIPVNDPSLLWINSGVATLKDYFSGTKKAPSNRMTNSQRSIRTNDIENVGVTARHHTLFEMLGNFSIGDYFKNEVLGFASELLFDVFELDKNKVYMTYYEDDKETYDKWIELGIDPAHLISGSRDMNFWDVGQGPCGPDTEIFYDRGQKYDPENIGIKLLKEDLENDRYVEIWNIVFSQFNNDGENNYSELVQKNIDTGAGLERLVSIFQDAPTNFDTDLFMPMINKVESYTNASYVKENYFEKDPKQEKINKSFKVIVDHIRSVAIAIHDGAKPSNNGRGYIIRRLLRRAVLEMMNLKVKDTREVIKYILPDAFDSVALEIQDEKFKEIWEIIEREIWAFEKTIDHGHKMIDFINQSNKEATPQDVFDLFATYGFPIDASLDLLDNPPALEEVLKYKKKHAEASRGKKKAKGMGSQIGIVQAYDGPESFFTGYKHLVEITPILEQGMEGNKNYILLDRTPFYATGGGQHCDKGTINEQEVLDVFKDKNGNNWHVTAKPVEGKKVVAKVDEKIRLLKAANHTATHLLGFVLRGEFGDSVVQLGSDNNEEKLRFDFPLDVKATPEEILVVERRVNSLIQMGLEVDTKDDEEIPIKVAKAVGAVTIPNEEYADMVRMVVIGQSIELCGGTHVKNTNEIETFKITKFESKGSGTYRIEAVTSNQRAKDYTDALIAKYEKELNQVIKKNQILDPSYSLYFIRGLGSIEATLKKAKDDNKKLVKKSKNISIDISNFSPIEKDGKSILEVEVFPGEVKSTALVLREAFKNSLIIVKAPKAKLVALASNKYDSAFEAKILFPNLKGGGNAKFIMGKYN